MILVDTSVWIDYFNGIASACTDALDESLTNGVVLMGDLIFLEILQGFRDDKEFRRAKTSLLTLEQHEMFDKGMSIKCANNYRSLRKSGITIRSTVDVIVATFCIENRLPLLYSDRDFIPFTQKLGLRSILVDT